MRLFELLDKPLPYKLMNTSTDINHGEKDHEFGFRVGDYWYKVYIDLYPMLALMDEEDAHGNDLSKIVPPEFVEEAERYKLIMTVDFGQFEYGEKKGIPMRGSIPIGVGPERTGREGTGNELQVFATVAAIAQDVFDTYRASIGAIEYGAKQEDPKRKRMYDAMMRKFGVSGKSFNFDDEADGGALQTRTIIVL